VSGSGADWARALDRVVAPGGAGDPSRGLAAALRPRRGGLCARAAESLAARLRPGGRVWVVTGLVVPGTIPRGETDGPPGAAVLARALALGFGARVLLLAEAPVRPVVTAALDALAGAEGGPAPWRRACRVAALPRRRRAAAFWIGRRFRRPPGAVVAVEKLGPNEQGVVHTAAGLDVTAAQARTEVLFVAAQRRGILRVGVGDRGNEVGFGAAARRLGAARGVGVCACPCASSIACIVASDAPVAAATSNWGAYGVVAALAVLLRVPRLLHDPRAEVAMLAACVRAGAVDGMTRRAGLTVDGLPLSRQRAMVRKLRALVEVALRAIPA
jgi:hypothetical protein